MLNLDDGLCTFFKNEKKVVDFKLLPFGELCQLTKWHIASTLSNNCKVKMISKDPVKYLKMASIENSFFNPKKK